MQVSDAGYHLLFEANPLPMWVIDRETLAFLGVNQAAVDCYGYSREEFLSITLKDIHPPEDVPRFLEAVRNFVSDEDFRRAGPWRHRKNDRRVIDVEVVARPLMFAGRPACLAIMNDTTERRRAEKALHESEQRFSKVFRANPAAIAVGDVAEGQLLDVNDRCAEFFGYRRDELIGRTASELNLWARPRDCEQVIQKLRAEGSVRNLEAKFRRKSGEVCDALLSMEIIEISDEGEPLILTMLNDVTERKKTEESLRQLSARLLQLQDEERRRIARELHDSTAQILAGLAMNLTSVKDSAAALDPKARKVLSDSLALAEQCTREIRTLSYLLHPPLLDEVGLVSALRWYTKGFAERSGIRVDFEVFPELGRLPPETETALFRIVQECLSNILRHSASPTARIRIDRKPTEIILEVRDEGKGMNPDVLEKARGDFNALGVGIAGMRERLRQLGGRLEVDSGKGGTMVKAILSIQRGK